MQLFLHYFNMTHLLLYHKATLVVAINEIKKSAREQGLSFYEYGTNPSLSFACLFALISVFTLLKDDMLFACGSNAKSRSQH